MINVTEKLETLEHESTLIVHETLKRKKRINKDMVSNLVDVIKYTNNYFNKHKENDEVMNINNKLIEEIITLDKKQIIKYNGLTIKHY